jgi:hypothetical protein
MRRDDSVFFFTLVDFLLTALFFGLVVFAVGKARARRDRKEQKEWSAFASRLRTATGISDLTVLTDRLTRLGPLKNAEEALQVVKQVGGPSEAGKAIAMVVKSGGSDTVRARLERLRQREGAGKPHCLLSEVEGKPRATAIATVMATDSTISFEKETPELRSVLSSIQRTYEDVRSLGLRDFARTFEPVLGIHPECLYTLEFIERTRYIDARDAARGVFYLRIRH